MAKRQPQLELYSDEYSEYYRDYPGSMCPICNKETIDKLWYGSRCFKGTCRPFNLKADKARSMRPRTLKEMGLLTVLSEPIFGHLGTKRLPKW